MMKNAKKMIGIGFVLMTALAMVATISIAASAIIYSATESDYQNFDSGAKSSENGDKMVALIISKR